MKKIYSEPNITITIFQSENIVAVSGGLTGNLESKGVASDMIKEIDANTLFNW